MRHLPPRKALPNGKTDRHSRIKVSPTSRRTRQNRKRNTNPEREADLQNRPESGEPEVFRGDLRGAGGEGEARDGADAGEDVEEDARGFGHAFAEDAGAGVLEVEFALRDGFGGDDVSGEVFLDGFGGAEFEVVGLEAVELVVCHFGGVFFPRRPMILWSFLFEGTGEYGERLAEQEETLEEACGRRRDGGRLRMKPLLE
ncbi:uncharacterized protein KY384_007921 [Bacidia gigantensis]|uniref:uncharacterized protein n=1 Tax=Bacidia gigantensis TaxID=2732470 RepID=UPI001D045315|nr:uncharacterized protein KY384_007921 [Bacidia gigantensis]KAG8527767.1 hypothetical protein KY384_007921 [Bacidia gigantensis]